MRRTLVALLLLGVANFLGVANSGFALADVPTPILRTELATDSAVPGQSIELRLTLLVPTWLPTPPVFPTFEAANVVVRGPESNATNQRVDGKTWFGLIHTLWVHPMTIGQFRFSPQPVVVTFADPVTREPRTATLVTEEVVFEGVTLPGVEDLDPFIAANSLILEQSFEGEPGELEPGDAFTRTVTARVTGTAAVFVPPLIRAIESEDIAAYPKEPVVSESPGSQTLSGERVEIVTYVAAGGGSVSVPPIQLRWFNLETRQVETSELEGFEIVSHGPWLPTVAGVLAVILVLGVVARLLAVRFAPSLSAWRERRRQIQLASEAWAFDQAIAALGSHDFGASTRAVDRWLRRIGPNQGGGTALAAAFADLGAALYGRTGRSPTQAEWLAASEALGAMRKRLLAAEADQAHRSLPPLNPREAAAG